MKQYIFMVITGLFLMSTTALSACPTCIGQVEQYSPPFFTKEFYNQEDNKELLEDPDYTQK